MKTKMAMRLYYPSTLVFLAGLGLLAQMSARHYLSAVESWRIAGMFLVLCLCLWMVMLWTGNKYKANPELATAQSMPAERIFAGLALLFLYANLFCFFWPPHQSLVSVESRWQFVFLVGVLLLAGLFMVRPVVFQAGKTTLDARSRTLKMILPRLIGFCAVMLMLQVIFHYWQIQY